MDLETKYFFEKFFEKLERICDALEGTQAALELIAEQFKDGIQIFDDDSEEKEETDEDETA